MDRQPIRILITGSRTWTDQPAIAAAIRGYLRSVGTSIGGAWPFPIVVHGGARGADRLADDIARGWGWTTEPHPADWARHGRSAGYRRNAAMVALGAGRRRAPAPRLPAQGTELRGSTHRARELLVDALLRWRDTPWGTSVLLPVHDEIVAMVPERDGTAATAALVGCMQAEFLGVPIVVEADEPTHAWTDAA